MAIYVDRPTWPGHGMLWSHLISDTSYDELHDFAAGLGIPRRAFERDHYDVMESRFDQVVAAGAEVVTTREIVRKLLASGLRVRAADA
ncbi:DUF4031 domain-containing protein [Propionibacteriaceae bacterium Y2011]|uniref:DUF4031 domain-containing protein n=1 Tax=Microlunatus sp. Y2014 TaxID=3418488 RepID=UPI003B481846